jgi:hypothetical protein
LRKWPDIWSTFLETLEIDRRLNIEPIAVHQNARWRQTAHCASELIHGAKTGPDWLVWLVVCIDAAGRGSSPTDASTYFSDSPGTSAIVSLKFFDASAAALGLNLLASVSKQQYSAQKPGRELVPKGTDPFHPGWPLLNFGVAPFGA